MEDNSEYATFLRRIGQMNSEEILRAIAVAKTGSSYIQGRLPLVVEATAEGALKAFIAALEAHCADKLIDDSLK